MLVWDIKIKLPNYITMPNYNRFLEPGTLVKNPVLPEWGIGQVQSIIENRVTVNFENAGKVVIDSSVVELEEIIDNMNEFG